MKSAYYIMAMWQTGNVGSENIAKSHVNPENGFQTYEEAEQYMLEIGEEALYEYLNSWDSFCIMKVYEKQK